MRVSASNSLLNRELTGNFVSFGRKSPFRVRNSIGIRGSYGQIPYKNNREFLERNREIISPIREIFRCNRVPEMSAKSRSASSYGDVAGAAALATRGERQDAQP